MRRFLRISLIILFLFISVSPRQNVFASAPNISSYPQEMNINDSFIIKANMDGLSANSIYRLRIVLASSGTSNYFGSTYNGNEWYNGNPSPIDYSKFLSITTDGSGAWNGEITGKIESTDPNYNSAGTTNYDLKVGRYTQSGSTATWSNIVQTRLTAPDPTPTPTPTPQPTPTPTKTPTPTPTKFPTPTPTKSPTTSVPTSSFLSKTPASVSSKSASPNNSPSSILGASSKSAEKKQNTSKKTLAIDVGPNYIRFIALGIGLGAIACAIIIFLKTRTK